MKAKWLIDEFMKEHNEQDIEAILLSEGFEIKVGKYERFAKKEELPSYFDVDDCVIVYGSLEFVRQQQTKGYIPGPYFQLKNLECLSYTAKLDNPGLLLNDNHVFSNFSELVRRRDFFFSAFRTDELFIRPNSGLKSFTGLTLNRENFDEEINSLKQLSSIEPDTLIIVAPAQKIQAEYRLFIINRQVVAGSSYQKDGEVYLSQQVPDSVKEVGLEMANNAWQPDLAYVCDVAETPDGPKIVEFNAISTSGLYQANLAKLFNQWSEVACLEFEGELSMGDQPIEAPSPKFKF